MVGGTSKISLAQWETGNWLTPSSPHGHRAVQQVPWLGLLLRWRVPQVESCPPEGTGASLWGGMSWQVSVLSCHHKWNRLGLGRGASQAARIGFPHPQRGMKRHLEGSLHHCAPFPTGHRAWGEPERSAWCWLHPHEHQGGSSVDSKLPCTEQFPGAREPSPARPYTRVTPSAAVESLLTDTPA